MNAGIDIQKERTNTEKAHRSLLWVGIVSIVMLFAAFTSAYIVRKSTGNWKHFELPNSFYISTVLILVSSCTLWFSYKATLQNQFSKISLFLGLTLLLGSLFVVFQFIALFTLRFVLLKTLHHYRARGRNRQQALIVGTRARVREIVDTMIEQRQWGLKAVGIIALDTVDAHKVLYRYRDIPLVGSLEKLPDMIKSNHIDYVFCQAG